MRLSWKHVDECYLDWLRIHYESRIPYTNYGENQLKPFFGSLFEIGDLVYVTQVSSPKPRHTDLRESKDFFKIYHPIITSQLLCVVNLNYMFPVHKSLVNDLKYADIDKYRSFTSEEEKSKYIDLLNMEMHEINRRDIESASQNLYRLKRDKPNDRVSHRCFNFINLEQGALEYEKKYFSTYKI